MLILFSGSEDKTHIEVKFVLNILNIAVIIDLVTVMVCAACVVFGLKVFEIVLLVTPSDVNSTINCETVSLTSFS